MTHTFATADIMDNYPDAPTCDIQFRSFGRKKFHGRIRTVRCNQDNGLIRRIFKNPSEGEVLVVDGGGSLRSALMGDIIAGYAAENGWAGTVIYGVVRDSAVLDTLDFGTKALGTNPRVSSKTCAGETDITVSFGGVDFVPGHYLYSDEDGILVTEQPLDLETIKPASQY
ncbi:ribonuclease E activity regulator RraA [Neisseria animalis]|uniref:4-hydroxy-4-methyl-2-oxoglutarate aldolase n=1 Tax=Neisseria animalis TaxID=492 RepID=A0A5P3MS20_NEIAN|nr:ribonuclease E activity regulator RraA [Neisseria animalis]QEY24407.1 RraA family protein [Neisseria animalis]ROW31883.1 RraA family protein [Neisseria animalis]VEE06992.1 Putative regulator of ribonuclease activity [Neisseria animalis]